MILSKRGFLPVLSWLAVVVVLVFLVSDAWARGGRGGGGGRSFSRGGAASRGSFGGGSRASGAGLSRGSYARPSSMGGYSRQPSRTPSQRPSTQPARGERPSQLPGERPGGIERPSRPDQRPGGEGDREDIREDWQQHRQDMQDDRQQAAWARQQDRQEFYEDAWEEGGIRWRGGVWVGDWDEVTVIHIDDDEEVEWAGVVAGFALGTVVSAATFQSATTEAGCTLSEVQVNGENYFHCGNTWYTRAMQEGEVRYIVVPPPPGF